MLPARISLRNLPRTPGVRIFTVSETTRCRLRQRWRPCAVSLDGFSADVFSSSSSPSAVVDVHSGNRARLPRSMGGSYKKSPLRTVNNPPNVRTKRWLACCTRMLAWCSCSGEIMEISSINNATAVRHRARCFLSTFPISLLLCC